MNVTNWQKYTRQENWHPAAKLFPLIADEEMKGLAADIKAHGLLNPVVLYQDQVLDGRNRVLACKQADVKPTFIEWRSTNGTSPIEWVAAQNSHRRHLTPSQKAFVAVELEKLLAKEAKERQREHGGTAPGRKAKAAKASHSPNTGGNNSTSVNGNGKARDQAAKLVGVNARYVSDAKIVAAMAPDLKKKVQAGQMTLPDAKRQALRNAAASNPKPIRNLDSQATTFANDINKILDPNYDPKRTEGLAFMVQNRQGFGRLAVQGVIVALQKLQQRAAKFEQQLKGELPYEKPPAVWKEHGVIHRESGRLTKHGRPFEPPPLPS